MNKFVAFCAGAMLVALSVGCPGPANTNNANMANTNANTNTAIITNTNANTNTAATNANRDIARADYERERDRYDRDWRAEATSLGRTIGQGAEDAWVWTKVRAALATAENMPSTGINIDVDNGVVTLGGNVENNDQRTRAEQIARGVERVTRVENNLRVGPADANANANRNGNANR